MGLTGRTLGMGGAGMTESTPLLLQMSCVGPIGPEAETQQHTRRLLPAVVGLEQVVAVEEVGGMRANGGTIRSHLRCGCGPLVSCARDRNAHSNIRHIAMGKSRIGTGTNRGRASAFSLNSASRSFCKSCGPPPWGPSAFRAYSQRTQVYSVQRGYLAGLSKFGQTGFISPRAVRGSANAAEAILSIPNLLLL
jgi:hypothetical protein